MFYENGTDLNGELTFKERTALGRMQLASDETADHFKVKKKFIIVKEVSSYAGSCDSNANIIARSMLSEHEAWQIYVAVHETCHDIAGGNNGHNARFKEVENAALPLQGITKVLRPRVHVQWVKYQGKWYSWKSIMKIKKVIERKKKGGDENG